MKLRLHSTALSSSEQDLLHLGPHGGLSNLRFLRLNSKRNKLRLAASTEKDTPQETETQRQDVDESRKLYIQAGIVRVMKSRKELSHALLVKEVIEMAKSRFAPSIPMIKKMIEQLIDKQYLERADRDL